MGDDFGFIIQQNHEISDKPNILGARHAGSLFPTETMSLYSNLKTEKSIRKIK